ncbi:hypothetical protein RXV86_03775 [Alisedimentitalea sp. MJ-SS2]|uniref:hypothetical protein n=1 Tax=Aliisedimentitalea sp. MJ-SS2 TaxID=3049795 RepID=UPI002908AAEA|nr:hypothetical protein [Alisedimentitalea sp. MJ-SS2]MDU8926497.1 hypothetical protein [Alisedimentitalea sp. MJ-SS2]
MSVETNIVAAIYTQKPALKFGDIVDEFEQSLRTKSTGRRSVTFDHDDLVIVEIESLRIGLAWVAPETVPDEPESENAPYSLVIATGIDPDHPEGEEAAVFCAQLSEQILARTYDEMPYDTVFRAAFPNALDTEFLDQIAGGLQELISFEMPVETNGYQTATDESPSAALTDLSGDNTLIPDAVAEVAAAPRIDAGFHRLREAYRNAVRNDQAQTSVIWQAMMASANTMIETVTQGAEFVRQVSATPEADPYERLKRIRTRAPMARYLNRFDKAEYELYGSLLD